MIWTLGDFKQRLSADRRRPRRPHPCAGDARHPLPAARRVDMSMAAIVCRAAARCPLVFFMMKRLSEMTMPSLRAITTEAKLLLIGIPVFLWTIIPIYHLFPVRDLAQGIRVRRQSVADQSNAAEFRGRVSARSTTFLAISGSSSGTRSWSRSRPARSPCSWRPPRRLPSAVSR